MNPDELDATLIERLRRRAGTDELELYVKQGSSRRLVWERERRLQAEADERGWAVRAGGRGGSMFVSGSGEPGAVVVWPSPFGGALRLPEPSDPEVWEDPPHLFAPLATESELRALARAIERQLATTLPGARLELLALEDGRSESRVGSSRGVLVGWRTRLASLVLGASADATGQATVRAEWVCRELQEISPRRVADRVADLLTIARDGRPVVRDRCDIIAAPEVASRLVAGLLPLFERSTSEVLLDRLGGAAGIGSSSLTMIDDGRLPAGVLASPVDGEGSPTRAVVLVEEGSYRQPLLPWWSERPGCVTGGCSRRDGWRERPRVGPSHLYLRPDPEVRAADLVAALSRGYYLLDAVGPPRFDFAEDRFELGVRGFEMLGGRARMPVAGIALVGAISGLLSGIGVTARDLRLARLPAGLVGSPTLRIRGLELRARPAD